MTWRVSVADERETACEKRLADANDRKAGFNDSLPEVDDYEQQHRNEALTFELSIKTDKRTTFTASYECLSLEIHVVFAGHCRFDYRLDDYWRIVFIWFEVLAVGRKFNGYLFPPRFAKSRLERVRDFFT